MGERRLDDEWQCLTSAASMAQEPRKNGVMRGWMVVVGRKERGKKGKEETEETHSEQQRGINQ